MPPRTYCLTVDGELGDNVAVAFPGMTLTRNHGVTTFTGEIQDQAELQSVLRRLSDFGLDLLETRALPDNSSNRSDSPSVPGAASERN